MPYFLNKKHFENAKYYIKMITMTSFLEWMAEAENTNYNLK